MAGETRRSPWRGWLRADRRPSGPVAVLHRETVVARPLHDTFAFFADATNLERLTPPWLNFRIVTPRPIAMQPGTEIEYRIVLYGLPIPWLTQIDAWEPGVRFIDRQVYGPYRWWHHEHQFVATPEGTRVIDHVEYIPRLRSLTAWIVRRDVERIFTYRQQALQTIFA